MLSYSVPQVLYRDESSILGNTIEIGIRMALAQTQSQEAGNSRGVQEVLSACNALATAALPVTPYIPPPLRQFFKIHRFQCTDLLIKSKVY